MEFVETKEIWSKEEWRYHYVRQRLLWMKKFVDDALKLVESDLAEEGSERLDNYLMGLLSEVDQDCRLIREHFARKTESQGNANAK